MFWSKTYTNTSAETSSRSSISEPNCENYSQSRLVPIRSLSYGRQDSGNLLVQGENTRALAALAHQYAGRVRCIYIDPPYNNQEQYAHYRDDLDHEYVLVYAKNAKRFAETRNGLPANGEIRSRYKNPDNDKRGPWQSISAN